MSASPGAQHPGTLVATITTADSITYNVAVSGMTGDGIVTVRIPAGGAFDTPDGDGNAALDQHRQLGHLRHHRAGSALDAGP